MRRGAGRARGGRGCGAAWCGAGVFGRGPRPENGGACPTYGECARAQLTISGTWAADGAGTAGEAGTWGGGRGGRTLVPLMAGACPTHGRCGQAQPTRSGTCPAWRAGHRRWAERRRQAGRGAHPRPTYGWCMSHIWPVHTDSTDHNWDMPGAAAPGRTGCGRSAGAARRSAGDRRKRPAGAAPSSHPWLVHVPHMAGAARLNRPQVGHARRARLSPPGAQPFRRPGCHRMPEPRPRARSAARCGDPAAR